MFKSSTKQAQKAVKIGNNSDTKEKNFDGMILSNSVRKNQKRLVRQRRQTALKSYSDSSRKQVLKREPFLDYLAKTQPPFPLFRS